MHILKRHLKNSNRKTRKNKAFTLVELIVVVVIIAILIGVTIKGIYGYVTSSKRNTDVANAAAMQDALSSLALDDGVCEYLENENIALGTTWTATWRKPSNVDWGEFPEKIKDKILEMVNNELPEAKKKKNFTLTATNTARGLDVTVSAGTTATDSIIIDVASNDTGDKENTGGGGSSNNNTSGGTGSTGTGTGSEAGSGSGTGSTGSTGTGGGSTEEPEYNTDPNYKTCKQGYSHKYEACDFKEAGCEEPGYTTFTCKWCNATYREIIASYGGHDWDTSTEKCKRCLRTRFEVMTWKEIYDLSQTSGTCCFRVGHTKKLADGTEMVICNIYTYSNFFNLFLIPSKPIANTKSAEAYKLAKQFYTKFNAATVGNIQWVTESNLIDVYPATGSDPDKDLRNFMLKRSDGFWMPIFDGRPYYLKKDSSNSNGYIYKEYDDSQPLDVFPCITITFMDRSSS